MCFALSVMLDLMCSVWVARRPPGYAFLDFEDPRDASDAIRDLDGNVVHCSVMILMFLFRF